MLALVVLALGYAGVRSPFANCTQMRFERPVFLLHVQKAGGTFLCKHVHDACQLRTIRRNSSLCASAGPEINHAFNCAIAQPGKRGGADQFLAAAKREWNDPLIKRAQAVLGADATPQLCRVVGFEPWAPYAKSNAHSPSTWLHAPLVSASPLAPWWSAYTTVLILRDPVARMWSWMGTFLNGGGSGGKMFGSWISRALAVRSSAKAPKGHHPPLRTIYHAIHNAQTTILVPREMHEPSLCGEPQLRAAIGVASRFRYVLGLTDPATRDDSYDLAERAFGLTIPRSRRKTDAPTPAQRPGRRRLANLTKWQIGPELVAAVRAANEPCDIPLCKAAAGMIHARAAELRRQRSP
jgi:hypothetical protein